MACVEIINFNYSELVHAYFSPSSYFVHVLVLELVLELLLELLVLLLVFLLVFFLQKIIAGIAN